MGMKVWFRLLESNRRGIVQPQWRLGFRPVLDEEVLEPAPESDMTFEIVGGIRLLKGSAG